MKAFNNWLKNRNSQCPSGFQCPQDPPWKPHPPAVLDQWLAAFIIEVRKSDGSYYCPTSLNGLMAGIQRHLRENLGRAAPNIIDKKNDLFPKKKNLLDQLTAVNVEKLWNRGYEEKSTSDNKRAGGTALGKGSDWDTLS